MNKAESIYLDAIRFVCAVLVVFGHISGKRFTDGLFWQASFFMSQSVTVFFVLSGFVIAYALTTKEKTAHIYIENRMARIYSVVIPALIITACLDIIGRLINPSVYSIGWGFHGDSPFGYLASLFFLNEIWFLHLTPGSDLPFWSLGYEVWYYVICGVAQFLSRRKWLVIIFLLALVGPDIVAMMPLWLVGFAAYRLRSSAGPNWVTKLGRGRWATMLWAISATLLIVYEVVAWRYGRLFSQAALFFNRGELPEDYLVGSLFAVNFFAFGGFATHIGWRPAPPLSRAIHWLSGATFSIYLLHLPVAQFLSAILPENKHSLAVRCATILGTFVIIFLVASLTERRKEMWRSASRVFLSLVLCRRGSVIAN